jgi:hypothetical protein
VLKSFGKKQLPNMILLGNKVDLNHMQAVKSDKHFKFASSHNIKAYYCSAKTGD